MRERRDRRGDGGASKGPEAQQGPEGKRLPPAIGAGGPPDAEKPGGRRKPWVTWAGPWTRPPAKPSRTVIGRIASYLEETVAEWEKDGDLGTGGSDFLRRTSEGLRSLEAEWEGFQQEVDGLVDGPAGARRPAPSKAVSTERTRRQLQAALRVVQREGWRGVEDLLLDAVAPEYQDLLRDVIAQSKEEGSPPNATALKRAFAIASKEAETGLRERVAATREAIEARQRAMIAATAEIRTDILKIEREIEEGFQALKDEWRQSLARGELKAAEADDKTYSELREFVERMFRRSQAAPGATPTTDELRTKWRKAVSLPAVPRGALRRPAGIVGPVKVLPASDMRAEGRHITIVTTAAIPWMTGTSINPLLRAAYMSSREGRRRITLVMPWLGREDQEFVFPPGLRFDTPAEQEAYIRFWAMEKASLPSVDFGIAWYPAAWAKVAGSIMPTTDLIRQLPPECRDICILEEPEHLNWVHHGHRWNAHFAHVVGIAHTNYVAYARPFGRSTQAGSWFINSLCVAAYCDVVIKLSDTLQWLPGRCMVINVHGVRPDFLAIGARRATSPPPRTQRRGAYLLAKALWAKGYRELIDFFAEARSLGRLEGVSVSCIGSGPDSAEIRAEAAAKGLPFSFQDATDHADESIFGYDVFVNPSTSEVLCTATAEALAMGKIVVIADHPSNAFFKTFANARFFRTASEFATQLEAALEAEPKPVSPVERYTLSWEAATERLMDAAALPDNTKRQAQMPGHELAYRLHWVMGLPPWGDVLRTYSNAVPWKPYDGYRTPSGVLLPRATIGGGSHHGPGATPHNSPAHAEEESSADGEGSAKDAVPSAKSL